MIPSTYTHPGVNTAMLALSRNRRKAFLARRALASALYLPEQTYREMHRMADAYEKVAQELARRLASDFYVPKGSN